MDHPVLQNINSKFSKNVFEKLNISGLLYSLIGLLVICVIAMFGVAVHHE